VAVKRFMKERAERAALIDEVKGVLIDGSPKRLGRYRKYGLESADDFHGFFMNLGNLAFHSGDSEVIGRFLESLFELTGSGVVESGEVLKRIHHYGLRSIHEFDIDLYELILGSFVDYVCGLRETVPLNSCLGVLRGLAQGAVSAGFEAGVLALLDVLTKLDEHFEAEGLLVSRFYLRNVVIALVCFAGRRGDESLRNRVVDGVGGILGVDGARPPAVETESVPASEEGVGPPSPVG
jgi:hypothetical protein